MASLSRRAFVGGMVGLGVSALAGACADRAVSPRPSSRPWQIGYLGQQSPDKGPASLREAMSERGFVEGVDYTLEFRFANNEPDRLPALARELVDFRVDVIFTVGTVNTVQAAMDATQTIPIVFSNLRDPVGLGIVADLARPGGNVTGAMNKELTPKRLQLLKETVPGLTRLSVLGNTLAYDIDGALRAVAASRADALLTPARVLALPRRAEIAEFALKSRLPSVLPGREFIEAGGLLSYWTNSKRNWWRGATYVDRISKGASPGDLPMEDPMFSAQFVLNLCTAAALGITIPPAVLSRVSEAIPCAR